jgi:predicted nuclease of predicted toxin-antitoxin system
MRLLLDMNVSPKVAERLRAEGHDAVHLRGLGFGRLPDHDVFAHAKTEQPIVVTFDLDFGEIVGQDAGTGVVLLRLRSVRPAHVQQRVPIALNEGAAALRAGAVVLVEDARICVRTWPIAQGD